MSSKSSSTTSSSTSSSYSSSSNPMLDAYYGSERVRKIRTLYNRKTSQSKLLQTKLTAEQMNAVGRLNRSAITTGPLIGEGSFSQVYQVTNIDLSQIAGDSNRRVCQELQERARNGQLVLKQLKSNGFGKDWASVAADLVAEAALLMRLNHQHLLPVRGVPATFLEAFATGMDGFFLLLDRLDTTMDTELNKWRKIPETAPSTAQRLEYARQMVQVLQYLHGKGVVYRDFKPDNIGLCRSTDQIQLFDLGLSRQMPESSSNSNSCLGKAYKMSKVGTPRYLAPEVGMGHKYNASVDIYGWSILVWEMMALEGCFVGYSRQKHFQRVCVGGERPNLKALPSLSSQTTVALQSILTQAWHRDYLERPSATALLQQWSAFEKTTKRFSFFRRRSSIKALAVVSASCA